MSLKACLVCAVGFSVLAAGAFAQDGIEGIGPRGEIQKVQGDFQFTEGPAWDGNENLYFTDIPANRIYRLGEDGKIAVFLEPSHHANGLMVGGDGTLFACQMDGQVVSIDPETKESHVVAGEYMGERFNAPNDLVIDRAGGIYFTDPAFRAPQPLPQGVTAVYYVDADGNVTRLIADLPNPNGVILSPDEKTLYVIPSGQKEMMAYPVEGPGQLGQGRVFCTLQQRDADGNSGGDGLTIDTEGNLYITSGLGLQVFDPEGKPLGIIKIPEQPANVTFGGPDRRTLYVTARTSLYAAEMQAQGHAFGGKE
jgi:gluconolactonase